MIGLHMITALAVDVTQKYLEKVAPSIIENQKSKITVCVEVKYLLLVTDWC